MIKIIVSKGVHISGLDDDLKKFIKSELTFKNPKYENAKKHGGYVGPSIPPLLTFYSESPKRDILYIPKGFLWRLINLLKSRNLEYSIQDASRVYKKLNFTFNGKCRAYQSLAIKDMLKYPIGVLEAKTGSGKTFMGIKILQMRAQPTLILVHTKELLYQWHSAVTKLLDFEPGLIGDGNFLVRKVTIGIINSVNGKTDKLLGKFGMIIIDECHRCPSTTFTQTLVQFDAKYLLGLSATAFRSDGLTKVIYCFVGPRKHKVDDNHLMDTGAVLRPDVYRVSTNFRYYFKGDYAAMMKSLTTDEERNDLIVKEIIKDYRYFQSPILVVSDRVQHCEYITEKLLEQQLPVELLVSKVSAGQRKDIVQQVRDGKVDILVSTLSLIAEGFDAPNLHALFLTTPITFDGRLIQVCGRVLRPEEGKIPRIYDFRDEFVLPLCKKGRKRDLVFKKEWGK